MRGAGLVLLVAAFGAVAEGQSPAPAAPAAASAATTGGTVHGTVKAGAVPLPGVAVTATNTLTGKKYTTSTDVEGKYAMTIPRTGRYVVRAELAAFAAETKEVRLTAEAMDQTAEFAMQLASRVARQEQAAEAATAAGTQRTRQASIASGLQALDVTGGEESAADASASGGGQAGAALPTLAGIGGDGSDSVTVSGQMGQTNGLAGLSEDDVRQRIQEAMEHAREQGGATNDQLNAVVGMLQPLMNGGGFGGPGGGGPGGGRGGRGGGGGGGGFRGFNPTQPHGAIFWNGSNNALNAAPFSISGEPVANPAGYQNSFGLTFTGSPSIPGLVKASTKQFIFANLTGSRNINAVIYNGTVPTVAERAGNFSALSSPIYDPATGLPYANNMIPTNTAGCPVGHLNCSTISPSALALLKYYPAPNVTDVGPQGYNYQTITTAGSNSTAASLRFVRNLGNAPAFGGGGRGGGGRQQPGAKPTLRQNINFNGSYSHSASDQRNIFLPLGGATTSTGYATTAGYTVGYGRFTNNASLTWNRSHAMGRNYFTNGSTNPYLQAGLGATQLTQNPFFFGLPNLSFTGFTSLAQSAPSDAISQTISFSDFVSYSHKRHNMRFGGDIRRVHADSLGGSNPLGSLTFSGYATGTQAQSQSATTGSGFADFLIGLPQQSRIQASLAKTYLRENVFDWYAQDDWRVKGGLTLNYGLRYEYFGPYTEKNNRLVNLDHNANFTEVAPVTPNSVGPYQGRFNRSLVNPDHSMYAPRFGFAYRPPAKFLPAITKSVVVRGGYGMNYNTGQYASFAKQIAFQPPFAMTQTNSVTTPTVSGTAGCLGASPTTTANLTLTNPYGCSTVTVTNNFSVNKNYRLGHVQVWNLGIQKALPLQTVLNIDYNGSLGGALDIVRAPNRTPTGLLNGAAQSFSYEDSLGFSRLNVLAVNVRKRQQKGISIQATYWYRHSIDNATSIGGTGNTPAQNDLDLNAEEGNSSFVVRHQLTGNWVLELPVGPNRALLNKGGFWSRALDGFNLSGNYSFASGTYFTPNYTGTVAEVATGATGSLRPNRNFDVPVKGAGKLVRNGLSCLQSSASCWFNPAAFSTPAVGQYGTASRGDIEGPGTVTVSSALSRTISFGNTRSFEMRMTAANVFNTVQYTGINTTLNSPTFGQVTGAAARRSLTFVGRYRF